MPQTKRHVHFFLTHRHTLRRVLKQDSVKYSRPAFFKRTALFSFARPYVERYKRKNIRYSKQNDTKHLRTAKRSPGVLMLFTFDKISNFKIFLREKFNIITFKFLVQYKTS